MTNHSQTIIRKEAGEDPDFIRSIHRAAFHTPGESALVDMLRTQATPFISLVAERGGQLVGHVAVTPATLEGDDSVRDWMGLAPLAVLPAFQKQGIGGLLMKAAIAACADIGCEMLVLLGSPNYYPRFGFTPAAGFGLSSIYDAPPEAFMALALKDGAHEGKSGIVHYHPAFDCLE